MPSKVFTFVSRADLLSRRGVRNFGRFKMLTSGRVALGGPERCKWLAEDVEDHRKDALWAGRHGPVEGGALVVPFRREPDYAETLRAWRSAGNRSLTL